MIENQTRIGIGASAFVALAILAIPMMGWWAAPVIVVCVGVAGWGLWPLVYELPKQFEWRFHLTAIGVAHLSIILLIAAGIAGAVVYVIKSPAPHFDMRVTNILWGGTSPQFPNGPVLGIEAVITNSGSMPSVATDFALVAEVNGNSFDGQLYMGGGPIITYHAPFEGRPSEPETFNADRLLQLTAISPIQVGGSAQGLLLFGFIGAPTTLFQNGAQLTLSYRDVRSHKYLCHFSLHGRKDNPEAPLFAPWAQICK